MNKLDPESDIHSILGVSDQSQSSPLRLNRWMWLGVTALAAIALFFLFARGSSGAKQVEFTTEPASRGDLTVTVTATGTTEPRNEVSVGIEVSGTIAEVLVDYNDTVEEGDLLARIDTTILAAQVAQSAASLQLSRAARDQAQATLTETESELARLERVRELSGGSVPSAQDLDTARAARTRAEAALASADAQIRQSEAQLAVNRTQLEKAEVISPIRGVVLSRLVDPGQTVAASLQTPELFVIAEDLREMELSIEIDEADVGQVREGQTAVFTVDAYPDEEFPAEITQVRYAPISSAGVVTYEAILSVDNVDMRLRPGMTATAVITVQEIENALLVPNEALRFSPSLSDETQTESSGGILGALIPRPPRSGRDTVSTETSGKQRQIWVLDAGGEIRPVDVRIGASDGASTEIVSGELAEGDQIVIAQKDMV